MKKIALTVAVVLSMLWLSGCMVIDCDDCGPVEEVCVVPVPPPPPPPVGVIYVPGPPRPYYPHPRPPYYGPPHHWRR